MSISNYKKGWITWDAARGVHSGNHVYDCGAVYREDRAGKDSSCLGSELARPGFVGVFLGGWTE